MYLGVVIGWNVRSQDANRLGFAGGELVYRKPSRFRQELRLELIVSQVCKVVRTKDWLLCKFAWTVEFILVHGALVVVGPNTETLFFFGVGGIHFSVMRGP
jgi:hypothetical protein